MEGVSTTIPESNNHQKPGLAFNFSIGSFWIHGLPSSGKSNSPPAWHTRPHNLLRGAMQRAELWKTHVKAQPSLFSPVDWTDSTPFQCWDGGFHSHSLTDLNLHRVSSVTGKWALSYPAVIDWRTRRAAGFWSPAMKGKGIWPGICSYRSQPAEIDK